MLLTVPDDPDQRTAILYPDPATDDGATAWDLTDPHLAGDDKERAMKAAMDQGWRVAEGSEWAPNAGRWEITIELPAATR